MAESHDKTMNALAAFEDDGATSRQVAERMGVKLTIASKMLGDLHWMGKVEREAVRNPYGWHFHYRIKPPDVPPPQWRPELRLAAHLSDLF